MHRISYRFNLSTEKRFYAPEKRTNKEKMSDEKPFYSKITKLMTKSLRNI